ncbi:Replication protein A 32 kDa subunit [Melipona quadrifasciata]|uniref:Replication protein A 32 kDa subunit n=1 Tax=Melipona quadrifasciata TaxID=166423 RepID=A0A0M8ZUZ3_9HYME|nr:Replication protein A 32 kDa subunit [Melipona quadrifasciata]
MWSTNLDSSINPQGGFSDNLKNENQEKNNKKQTIVPAMIGNLLSFDSIDEPKIWHLPARMFMIVGLVRSVEETATKVSYNVEDETGTITALKWLEVNKKELTVQMNTYVRIIGLLREQSDKRHILILQMLPLQTLNELTNHILEVTYVTLKAKLMAQKHGIVGENFSSNEPSAAGMSTGQHLVYKLIQTQNDTESGIERTEIKEKVPEFLLQHVDDILEFLVSEGHIYTTSSDDHFKTI